MQQFIIILISANTVIMKPKMLNNTCNQLRTQKNQNEI